MDLSFDLSIAAGYTSNSQIARILTEHWVGENVYCPACGASALEPFKNNNPVGDFHCCDCRAEYELKSKTNGFAQKIVDGAYGSMIGRINSSNNPHFFFLDYSPRDATVSNFLVIPKHYFVDDIIEPRKPLAPTAKRAGWIGCNILLNRIPASGKIFLVKDSQIVPRDAVLATWNKTAFLANQRKEARGWTIETLRIVDRIPSEEFCLEDVYKFEAELKSKFPVNNFVRDKLRQQLQILRDRGVIQFLGRGKYRKTRHTAPESSVEVRNND
jgi:type II restriction enzyme